MTTIKITVKDCKFRITSSGHSEHDVCIAISALINSVVVYGENYCEKNFAWHTKKEYTFGNVDYALNFMSKKLFNRFLRGIDATVRGIRLYANEQPKEVKFEMIQ